VSRLNRRRSFFKIFVDRRRTAGHDGRLYQIVAGQADLPHDFGSGSSLSCEARQGFLHPLTLEEDAS